ncbi:MAG: flavodoxin family protein [Planctomycetota bacterium]|jgi:multimeric flavodoxin WrbA
METDFTRRNFMGAAGAVIVAGAATVPAQALAKPQAKTIRIVGICCSPRKGKTTTASLRVCLEAAGAVNPQIQTDLIELAGMKIDGSLAAGIPLEPGQKDDFPKLVPKLSDPSVAGIIIGTPVYFNNMTSLCKAFLDRCIAFRKNNFVLSNKVAGVLAVGGARNGGQEITIQSVQAALFGQEMVIVGGSRPNARIGATVWNSSKGDVTNDEFGMTTARNLGHRVAEVALKIATTAN